VSLVGVKDNKNVTRTLVLEWVSYQNNDASVLSVYGDAEWAHPEAQVRITEALIYVPYFP